jgi:drug/metabolite transporter (DMT)-like permease
VSKTFLLLPLLWGILYALAALLTKRAFAHGVGPWRVLFLSNLGLVLAAVPMLLLEKEPTPMRWYAEPLLTAAVFFAGQTFTTLAIHRGDVSISTPVLGTKVVFVAFLTRIFLKEEVPFLWWTAAFLSVAGVFLLGFSKDFTGRRSFSTLIYAILAALCYGSVDVLTQKFVPVWGSGKFLPMVFFQMGVFSLIIIPFFRQGLREIERPAWNWLIGAIVVGSIQCMGMALTIGYFGHATAINIVYSLRGVWSLVLVILIGTWLGSQEHLLGRRTLAIRFIGALSLVAAVILVMSS